MSYSALIVDDEPLTRDYLVKKIPEYCDEFSIIKSAQNGSEALSIIRNENIDLVITDIRMPEMDGIELTKLIKQHNADQLVVILSGFPEFSYAQKAISYGVSEFLLKPIDSNMLSDMLKKMKIALEARKAESILKQQLEDVQTDYKSSIISDYLESLANNDFSQKMSTTPLIRKMDIPIFKRHNFIMSFGLDYNSVLSNANSSSDFDSFDFVLYKTLRSLSQNWIPDTINYFGGNGYNLLISLDDNCVSEVAEKIYDKLNSSINDSIGLTVISSQMEVFQTHGNFSTLCHRAHTSLLLKLFSNNNSSITTDPIILMDSLILIINARREIFNAIQKKCQLSLHKLINRYINYFTSTFSEDFKLIILYLFFTRDEQLNKISVTSDTFRNTLDFILNYIKSPNNCDSHASSSIITQACLMLMGASIDSFTDTLHSEQMELAKQFIEDNYHNPISLLDLAEFIGVSPNYMSSRFHSYTKESFIKYLTRTRMEKSAEMLIAKPSEKISTVAEKCGFTSSKYFHYVFKRAYQQTPIEFQHNKAKVQ